MSHNWLQVEEYEGAKQRALHRANTLGGTWFVWIESLSGDLRITCPELCRGYILAITEFDGNHAILKETGETS